MRKTLTINDIASDLLADEYANWSYAGAHALAEYLDQMEEEAGMDIEYDRVAIRCDYAEYGSLEDWSEEYFANPKQAADELNLTLSMDGETVEEDADQIEDAIREYIENSGQLVEFEGGIIVSSF